MVTAPVKMPRAESGPRLGWLDEEHRQMVALRLAGLSWQRVARKLGRSFKACTVRASFLRKTGLWAAIEAEVAAA